MELTIKLQGEILVVDIGKLIESGFARVETTAPKASEPKKPHGTGYKEVRKLTYVQRAIKGWEMYFGAGSGAGMWGRCGKALKPLVAAHGEEAVMLALNRYLSPATNPTERKFVTFEAFASKYLDWAKAGKTERNYDAPEVAYVSSGTVAAKYLETE